MRKMQLGHIFCKNKTHNVTVRTAVFLTSALLAAALVGFTPAKDSGSSSVENINLTVTDCNVTLKILNGKAAGASAAKDGFKYEIDETKHKLTAARNGSAMTIDLESTGKPNEGAAEIATIFIPEQQYSKITVVGNNAGVSLPSLNADYHLTNNNGAMSMCVSKEFSKTIDLTVTNGSGSLVLSSLADNYTLNMTGETSAISVSPELPKYTFQPNYKYVKGNGKAVINLNITNSAFSIVVDDIDDGKIE